MKTPHRETSLRVTADLIALYKRRARRLRSEAWRSLWRALWCSLVRREIA